MLSEMRLAQPVFARREQKKCVQVAGRWCVFFGCSSKVRETVKVSGKRPHLVFGCHREQGRTEREGDESITSSNRSPTLPSSSEGPGGVQEQEQLNERVTQ